MKPTLPILLVVCSFIAFKSVGLNRNIAKSIKGRIPASDSAPAEVKPEIHCQSESKGEKLKTEVEKLLEDKEEVIKKVEDKNKTKDNDKVIVQDDKNEKEAPKKLVDNSDLMNLLTQMTSMISLQMQSQMQLQMQMMSMLSLMQNNNLPQVSPYAYMSDFQPNLASGINNQLEIAGMGIGMPQSPVHSMHFHNPYSQLPQLERTAPSLDSGFLFNQQPMLRGFDFSSSQMQSPTMPLGQEVSFSRNNI